MGSDSTFILTLSTDENCSAVVTRTYSSEAESGVLQSGDEVFVGDKLKIQFTSSDNYTIKTRTVNGKTFVSGNTHTVSGNVAIVVRSTPLSSDVSATNARVGGTSDITVTKKVNTHFHSLRYEFGSLSGYISNSGYAVASESVYGDSSVSFIIPSDFYKELGDETSMQCRIVCRTYSDVYGDNQVGDDSYCDITISISAEGNAPSVTGTVEDINEITAMLTGDPSVIVRYLSDVRCTIQATAKNEASIVSTKINSVTPTDGQCTFENVSSPIYTFYAVDSRGYGTTETVTAQMVEYVRLTIHPTITRSADRTKASLSFVGKFFNGSFGAYKNNLTIRYRYRITGESDFSDWISVDSSLYTIGASSYESNSSFELAEVFDADKGYLFEVQAIDGANETQLSSATKAVTITGGLPVFDWGENNFNFNVPIQYNQVALFDIIYPIGSIYMSSSSTLPESMSTIGTWTSKQSTIENVYMWERTL